MIRCAVIGNPISHSISPEIHQRFAKSCHIPLQYDRIEGDLVHFEDEVRAFFTSGGLGLNVTLPFKERAFAMANWHSERCLKAKAANTLWMKDGKLCADNTDGVGLVRDLSRDIKLNNARILILGAGGAVRGIIHPLQQARAKITIKNRDINKAKKLCEEYSDLALYEGTAQSFDVIIHATSIRDNLNALNFNEDLIKQASFAYDLNYDFNKDTAFVSLCHKALVPVKDGRGMLIEQARESFFIWHHLMPEL